MTDATANKFLTGVADLLKESPFKDSPELIHEQIGYALALEDCFFMVSKVLLEDFAGAVPQSAITENLAKLNAMRAFRRSMGLAPFNTASLVK